jgi:hypothetical protein
MVLSWYNVALDLILKEMINCSEKNCEVIANVFFFFNM